MKKLYLNLLLPGLLIGLMYPFSNKVEQGTISHRETTANLAATASFAELTESVCGEVIFNPGSPAGTLQLPAFDPAKGQLTGIQITTEGTLIADINRFNLSHTDYHALFSADLKCVFPGNLEFSHTTRLNYQASISNNPQQASGIEAVVDATATDTKNLTESLESFYGTGNISIPMEAANLIDLRAENFEYRTQLRARVCIDYSYQDN